MRYAKSGREVKCTKGDNRFLEVRVEVMYSDVEPLRVLSHSPSKKPGYGGVPRGNFLHFDLT